MYSSNPFSIKYLRFVLLFLLAISSHRSVLSLPENSKTIHNKINKILENSTNTTNIGVVISRLKDNKLIYAKNADQSFSFASCHKLFLTAALIEKFGEQYQFEHKFNRLGDDYYLDIGDDPNFNYSDLLNILYELKKAKVDHINGKIFILNKHFSLPPTNPYKIYDDCQYCYGALVTRTHINQNCYKLYVKPGLIDHEALVLPEIPAYEILNQTRTIDDKNVKSRIFRRFIRDKIIVTGTIDSTENQLNISPVAENYTKHFAQLVRHALKELKINFDNEIEFVSSMDPGVIQLITKTKPIENIYRSILADSNNFTADYMLMLLTEQNKYDEWFEMGNYVKDYISKNLNIDLTGSISMDGSGLSRLNVSTPMQYSHLLKVLYNKPYFEHYKSYLAQPKSTGTLKNRLENLHYKLYAKTGYMKLISALVGYIDKDGELYSFAIVFNNNTKSRSECFKIKEQILDAI